MELSGLAGAAVRPRGVREVARLAVDAAATAPLLPRRAHEAHAVLRPGVPAGHRVGGAGRADQALRHVVEHQAFKQRPKSIARE